MIEVLVDKEYYEGDVKVQVLKPFYKVDESKIKGKNPISKSFSEFVGDIIDGRNQEIGQFSEEQKWKKAERYARQILKHRLSRKVEISIAKTYLESKNRTVKHRRTILSIGSRLSKYRH